MKLPLRLLLAFALTAPSHAAPQREVSLANLCERHQWFDLESAIRKQGGSTLYRGVAACAFNRSKECLQLLKNVTRFSRAADAYLAHSSLEDVYLRKGLYRQALSEAQARLSVRPEDPDAQTDVQLLREFPHDQSSAGRPSQVNYREESGIPIVINGHDAYYSFDTGASLSFMSESEALRLGLAVRQSSAQVGNIAGRKVGFKTAVADRITIANFRFKHVAFLIFPDDQPPFNTIPAGHRGVLGIPVLLAFKAVCLHNNGELDLGYPLRDRSAPRNLAFDGQSPIMSVTVLGKEMTFLLDTGAQKTFLYKPFAETFSELIEKNGKKDSERVTGIGGHVRTDSVHLPRVVITIGSFDVTLISAPVLLTKTIRGSSVYAGNLGLDVLNQARSVTIDFQSMTVVMQ